MFERFTERARQVVTLAQDEARQHEHAYIELEHLVVGIFREEHGLAARTLTSLGLDATNVTYEGIEKAHCYDPEVRLPFRAKSKKALELALREALALGHNYIGTEHVLLGILRAEEPDDVFGPSLSNDKVRAAVMHGLSSTSPWPKPQPRSQPRLAMTPLPVPTVDRDFLATALDVIEVGCRMARMALKGES